MPRYATALAGNPAQTYRAVDLGSRTASADSHGLVGLLYDELLGALRTAGWAAENRAHQLRNERVTRALAILFALENGLDFDKGGEVSRSLSRFYHGLRQQLTAASMSTSAAPFRELHDSLREIADAWASMRAG